MQKRPLPQERKCSAVALAFFQPGMRLLSGVPLLEQHLRGLLPQLAEHGAGQGGLRTRDATDARLRQVSHGVVTGEIRAEKRLRLGSPFAGAFAGPPWDLGPFGRVRMELRSIGGSLG